MTHELLLDARGIVKSFGGNAVLRGVDFDVRVGEVHALLGENGAGKSTLTKIIGGVHRADAGTVVYDGAPTEFRDPGSAVREGISTVYQELNLIPHLDCAANIFLGREPETALFAHGRQMRTEAAAALTEIGSKAKPSTKVTELSTAERQMVEIAKALATDARLIIMDEPTAALSSAEIERLHESIRRLTSRGISVIYISHKLDEVFRIADRISVMRDGKLRATVTPGESSRDEVVALMLGRELSTEKRDLDEHHHDRFDSEPMLAVTGLTVRGKIRDVSFSVRPGEILGMAGLVGAGRTETVRALVGLEPIAAGSIELDGKKYRPGTPAKAIANGMVLIPEDRKTQGLLLGSSIEDNVALPHLPALSTGWWVRRRKARALAERCVDEFDVRPRSIRKATTFLSGGNQQKVLIGRWLIQDYKVLIFDEPSKGVDVGARSGIWRMIREAADGGAAVVVISSETEELTALADRIVVMRGGSVSRELVNHGLTEDEVMEHAF
ncbi:MAG: sugar ABC transporter ATP-binding protein [Planctomycetes bacterium]|nr:sugar ABC transporter ATP-binding protein [Planctomycetota bacterium]|tara:strand:+ start:44500 stop:45996 length:1497 start_codon:yes stop_codon:yes gene_type:complete